MSPGERERYTRSLTRRTTAAEARLPAWADGGMDWIDPPSGERWEEFLTGLHGGAELREYRVTRPSPRGPQLGGGGYARVRGGRVEDVYMLLLA